MDQEQDDKQEAGNKGKPPPPRIWTQRTREPLRFRRYTDTDGEGRPSIIYKFESPPGEDLPQAVYDVLNGLKHREHPDGGQFSTHLRFKRDKKHGRVWTLRNDPVGRATASMLDEKLLELAAQLRETSHER